MHEPGRNGTAEHVHRCRPDHFAQTPLGLVTLSATATKNRQRSAAHKFNPTSCGSWLSTPHAANCGRALARFLRALAGTLGALRRHFLPCLCWDGCMRHRIHAKALITLAFCLDVCARAYIVCATAYWESVQIAGNPPTLDAISTGNPDRHLSGISDELRAARQGAFPFPPLFATLPPVPTRLFDLLRKCSPFPMARRLPVSVQSDGRFFSSPCSARAERTSFSSSSPRPFLSMSFRMAVAMMCT